MLSVKKLNLAQAATYYSKDNYYTQQIGELYGKLKDELGLNDLTHTDFTELLNGRNNGEFLTAAKTNKSVPGFDFTFSANKSLSIAFEIASKEDKTLATRLQKIHDTAVNKALNHIEKYHIQTRMQKNKKNKVIKTNNMIAAKFQHDTSRALDPQLHTHCVIFNFTKVDGKYRTLDMQNLLKKNSKIVKNLGSYYRHHLKDELLKAGIDIRVTNQKENFFELKNIDNNLIEAFSKRREAIEKEVKRIKSKYPNASKTELYQIATLNTRVAKKDVNRDEVRDINISLAKKYIDTKELIKSLKSNKSIDTKSIDEKSLSKVVKKAEKSIKNDYHKTADNIADRTLKMLNNISVNIDTIYLTISKIKQQDKEIEDFKQTNLKSLRTMDDVVKHQLKLTKLKGSFLKSSNIVNIDTTKLKKEEILENARLKISNANKTNQRSIAKYRTSATATITTYSNVREKLINIDRESITQRAVRQRKRGDNFKRFDDCANRSIRGYKQTVKITKDDLRRDNQLKDDYHKRKKQNHNKSISKDR